MPISVGILKLPNAIKNQKLHLSLGCLDDSVGWASDFSSGHNLTVREFDPKLGSVLTAQSLEPASDSVSPSLSAPPQLALSRSLSKINKTLKIFFKCLFIFEREKVTEHKPGRGREWGKQNLKQASGSELPAEPNVGLEPTNREIMTWAEVGFLTDWATQAPQEGYL